MLSHFHIAYIAIKFSTRHVRTHTYIFHQTCSYAYLYFPPDIFVRILIFSTRHVRTHTYIFHQTCSYAYLYFPPDMFVRILIFSWRSCLINNSYRNINKKHKKICKIRIVRGIYHILLITNIFSAYYVYFLFSTANHDLIAEI